MFTLRLERGNLLVGVECPTPEPIMSCFNTKIGSSSLVTTILFQLFMNTFDKILNNSWKRNWLVHKMYNGKFKSLPKAWVCSSKHWISSQAGYKRLIESTKWWKNESTKNHTTLFYFENKNYKTSFYLKQDRYGPVSRLL